MKKNITLILFILICSTVASQQVKIEELECRKLQIGFEKTFHIIFPVPVKYLNIGSEDIIGEIIPSAPHIVRLKSTVRNFSGETNLSAVTEDSKYYSYCFSFNENSKAVYKEGSVLPETPVLPVSEKKLMHIIYPDKIIYVDFGNTSVHVEKANNIDNIIAVKADKAFSKETNLTAITQSGEFYTFGLNYAPNCEVFSFVVDNDKKKRQVAILDNKERNTAQKERIRKEIESRPPSLSKIYDEISGMSFALSNIFVDQDLMLFKFHLFNKSQIGYTVDFVRFYIQDSKIRKKTAVQQTEQQVLFSFDQPEEVAALETKVFTVALNKFTIPDKKNLIIEIQEKNGGRHFFYKMKNKQLIDAEILFPTITEEK